MTDSQPAISANIIMPAPTSSSPALAPTVEMLNANDGPQLHKELSEWFVIELMEQPEPASVVALTMIPGPPPSPRFRKLLRPRAYSKPYLPGQPRIHLPTADVSGESDETARFYQYLRQIHLTPTLDTLVPRTKFIFVQLPSYHNIIPLHANRAYSREIVVNETPGLHLVTRPDRVFLQPIPPYLYSPVFWEYVKDWDHEVYKAALGFMRSYSLLIKHELDFDEACTIKLIPRKADGNFPTFEELCHFIVLFESVSDTDVSRRYCYGELDLLCLNLAAYLLLFKPYFLDRPQRTVLEGIAGVFLLLTAMQVTLAALDNESPPNKTWPVFLGVSRYFSIIVIVVVTYGLFLIVLNSIMWGGGHNRWDTFIMRRKEAAGNDGGFRPDQMLWLI
ncbi:hypothetical protein B0H66DRAFT_211836 [Apodospora peruviana]|uniref:Uncharacterized protein n=1 Tax=Apodospora peruviana TaxID=516989 RepID=A0AAE0ICN3_9PEZI|nr:hypothetical protein B0H66DRAFT_211836 [Apodospora peruviana]